MIIASVAYNELPSQVKSEVNLLLKSHPEYDQWSVDFERFKDTVHYNLETYVFLRASVWPDEIRTSGSNYFQYSHHVEFPLRAPLFGFEPPTATNNVVLGIVSSEKVLSNRALAPNVRAMNLSWLVHLVADIHQPLHCGSLFSSDFPHGDKIGMLSYIKISSEELTLDRFWDRLLGTERQPGRQIKYAEYLRTAFPPQKLDELAAHGA